MKPRFVLPLVLFTFLYYYLAAAVRDCAGVDMLQVGGRCWRLFQREQLFKSDWNDAMDTCCGVNAVLASISDIDTLRSVQRAFSNRTKDLIWISLRGLRDGYFWMCGRPESNRLMQLSYFLYAHISESDRTLGACYGVNLTDLQFQRPQCDEKHSYICEYAIDDTKPSGTSCHSLPAANRCQGEPLSKSATRLPTTTDMLPVTTTTTMTTSSTSTTNSTTINIFAANTTLPEMTTKALTTCAQSTTETVTSQTTAQTTTAAAPTEESTPAVQRNDTRPFPMTPTQRVVATVIVTFGAIIVFSLVSIVFVTFLVIRDFSFNRIVHMIQEMSIGLAQLMILGFHEPSHESAMCKWTAAILQFVYSVYFLFCLIEAIQTHCILTNVIVTGSFINRLPMVLCGLGLCGMITVLTASVYFNEYPSDFSCWINYSSYVGLAILGPMCTFVILSVIVLESSTMYYSATPMSDRQTVLSAKINHNGLLAIVAVNFTAMLMGTLTVYFQKFALYSFAFALNVASGVLIYIFHTLGDTEYRRAISGLLKKITTVVKTCRRTGTDDEIPRSNTINAVCETPSSGAGAPRRSRSRLSRRWIHTYSDFPVISTSH